MSTPTTIHFVSLGCARNLVDSEVMLGVTTQAGFQVVTEPQQAEVIVVNTCGFIDAAKRESIDTILQMADYKSVARCKTLVVTGCLTERYADELQAEMPEVDYFIGTGEFPRIAEILTDRPPVRGFFRRPKFLYGDDTPRVHSGPAHSAYLKVAEGCSTRCAFCIIPKLRGPLRSREPDGVVREAQRLADGGVRELLVIAQDSTDYGRDLGDPNLLGKLLRRLDDIDALRWIRVLYCYPDKFTEELIDVFASSKRIVPYVDIPIQHAHDDVLRAMNRSVTSDKIRWLIDTLRERVEGIALRTGVIVGFPGTDERHFEALCQFLEKTQFDHVGVFKYSREEGTVADRLEGHLDSEVIDRRWETLMQLTTTWSRDRLADLVDTNATVMIEGLHPESEHLYLARLPVQAPDVDGTVAVTRGPDVAPDAEPFVPGDIVSVRITDSADHDLAAVVDETAPVDYTPHRTPRAVPGVEQHPEPGRSNSSRLEVV